MFELRQGRAMRNRRGARGEGPGGGEARRRSGVRALSAAAAAPSPLPPRRTGRLLRRPRGGAVFAARGPPRSAHLRARGFPPWRAAFPFLCSSNLFFNFTRLSAS